MAEEVDNPVLQILAKVGKKKEVAQKEEPKKEVEEVKEEVKKEEVKAEESKKEEKVDEAKKEAVKSFEDIFKEKTGGKFESLEKLLSDFEGLRNVKAFADKASKNDFIKNAVDYYDKNGTLYPYLEAKAVDYDKMSDEDVLRKNFKKENPEYSEKVFEKLFRQEMAKYELNEEDADPEDIEILNEKKKVRAARLRSQYKEEQQKFFEPENNVDVEAQKKAFVDQISAAQDVKNLFSSKKLNFDIGGKSQDIVVDNPEDIFHAMIDERKLFENFSNKDGGLDFQKIFRVYYHALKGDDYDKNLIEIGRKSLEDELKNAKIDVHQHKEPVALTDDEKRIKGMLAGLKAYYNR